MTSRKEHENLKSKIRNNEYTLFDKAMYGGLGYGNFCMPTNFFKIIATVLFPPIGILIENVGKLDSKFPYFRYRNLKNIIFKIKEFIYSFVLTMMFYIPGLIYTLNKFKSNQTEEKISRSDFENTDQIDSNEFVESEEKEEEEKNNQNKKINIVDKRIDLDRLKNSLFGTD